MPAKRDDNALGWIEQAMSPERDDWEREIVPRLPRGLAEAARQHKAFRRVRGVASASDLLRALLAYVVCVSSFAQLGLWAVLLGVGDLSVTAWRNRLGRANDFLLWLVGELIAGTVAPTQVAARLKGRLWLVDGSAIPLPGGDGDHWRLHLGYDLLGGRMGQVHISDRHTGEHTSLYHFAAGDVVIADRAYCTRPNVAHLHRQQADFVLRYHSTSLPLLDAQAQPLDLAAWLDATSAACLSQEVSLQLDEAVVALRLIVTRLPPPAAEAARRRVRKHAQKKGYTPSQSSLTLAGWLVVVTSLHPSLWPDSEVLWLYRARWQIELVFKRMKQLLRLEQLRCRRRERVEATLRVLLVAWALQEATSTTLRQTLSHLLADLPDPAPGLTRTLSSWGLTALSLELLRQQIRGRFDLARLRALFPRFLRFLAPSPRRRRQLEAAFRLSLAPNA